MKLPSKAIAITFDDGPSASTEELLRVLRALDLHATFFLVGEHIRAFTAAARRILEDGHEAGGHSDDHCDFSAAPAMPEAAVRANLERVSLLIREISGADTPMMRAPYARYSEPLIQAATSMNMALIDISVNSLDYTGASSAEIVSNVVSNAYDGGIILLHEPYDTTRAALPLIAHHLRAAGYALMPVRALARKQKITLQAGRVYRDFV